MGNRPAKGQEEIKEDQESRPEYKFCRSVVSTDRGLEIRREMTRPFFVILFFTVYIWGW